MKEKLRALEIETKIRNKLNLNQYSEYLWNYLELYPLLFIRKPLELFEPFKTLLGSDKITT